MTNLIGHSLGRYHILEQLGQGGMATVYKAYDTRLERDVAVKVLRTDQFPPATLERILKRFEREARALAKLTHPNIVGVIDYGEYEGAPYLVMEYLPGGTLKQRLKDLGRPMPWQEALRLLLPIARALDYAHEHNILHRDVKPSNILLTEKGEPMLTDFGIAKILDLEDGQTLTATGVGVGTPEYMSPEQGLGKPVDARTDIYSLGVVLYEMVTGRKPFQADTPMAVVFQHVSDPLPRPAQFAPDLPEAVEKILLKALAKKPEDRYASMAEFAAAMEKTVISGQSPLVSPSPLPVEEEPGAKAHSPLPAGEGPGVRAHSPLPMGEGPGVRAHSPLPMGEGPGVRDDAATIDQPITGETVLQDEDRRPPSAVRHSPSEPPLSTVHRPSSINDAATIDQSVTGETVLQETWASAASRVRIIRAENISSPITLHTLAGHTDGVRSVAFSPDGHWLASGSRDNTVKVWEIASGRQVRTISGHSDSVWSVAFSPDGRWLASGSGDNTVKVWEVRSGREVRTLAGHTAWVSSVAFSPDGRWLASGSGDGTVKVWEVASGRQVRTLARHNGRVLSLAFSPDGRWLASGSGDGTVKVWEVASGREVRILSGHNDPVYSVAFSPAGRWLASGLWNKVKVWEVASEHEVYTLSGHTSWVNSVAFSPDGRWMASGSDDRTVKVWEVESGREVRTLSGHNGQVESITFSPDGRWLASGSWDGTVRLWGVR